MRISAKEINDAICRLHDIDTFNCMFELFGYHYDKTATYMITVSTEKIKKIKELTAFYFETYITHCLWIYEYLLEQGIEGDVYIK